MLKRTFKAYTGERSWEAIGYRWRRLFYLTRGDQVRKIRNRKQGTDIGKYSLQIGPLRTGTNYQVKR